MVHDIDTVSVSIWGVHMDTSHRSQVTRILDGHLNILSTPYGWTPQYPSTTYGHLNNPSQNIPILGQHCENLFSFSHFGRARKDLCQTNSHR